MSDTYAHIFYGVVCINLKVAFAGDGEVKEAMFCQCGEHVIEETNAGVYFAHP